MDKIIEVRVPGTEVFSVETGPTNADKARKAANLGQEARRMGVSKEDAQYEASHTLRHGLADKGRVAVVGVKKDSRGKLRGFYRPVGPRTPQELIDIGQADKEGMSDQDHEIVTNAEKVTVIKK